MKLWEADRVQTLGFALIEVDGLPSWDQGFEAQLASCGDQCASKTLRAGGETAVSHGLNVDSNIS